MFQTFFFLNTSCGVLSARLYISAPNRINIGHSFLEILKRRNSITSLGPFLQEPNKMPQDCEMMCVCGLSTCLLPNTTSKEKQEVEIEYELSVAARKSVFWLRTPCADITQLLLNLTLIRYGSQTWSWFDLKFGCNMLQQGCLSSTFVAVFWTWLQTWYYGKLLVCFSKQHTSMHICSIQYTAELTYTH